MILTALKSAQIRFRVFYAVSKSVKISKRAIFEGKRALRSGAYPLVTPI
jgi:hypothetical protein